MIFKRRKKRPSPAVTEKPSCFGPYDVAVLIEKGSRDDQQDACDIACSEGRLRAVLSDGMGGMDCGAEISRQTVASLMNGDSFEDVSAAILGKFGGAGGATAIRADFTDDGLMFTAAGDSDLMLLRGGRLYFMNSRHEYGEEIMKRAMFCGGDVKNAFTDPQSGALTSYIGCPELECDGSLSPFPVEDGDTFMLCSDGISDSLNIDIMTAALSLMPDDCVKKLKHEIENAHVPFQDNYTAVIIRISEGEKNEKKQ